MADLPHEVLIGLSYGLLFGLTSAPLVGFAAAVAAVPEGGRRSIPRGIVMSGGAALSILLALGGATIVGIVIPGGGFSQAVRFLSLSVVAGALGVVAGSLGHRVGGELPRDRTGSIVRGQGLSTNAIDSIDAAGQVAVRSDGSIRSFDGYPPPSPSHRRALETDSWRFPADLQRCELERRLELRLRAEYGFSAVNASIDGRGLATITAAPPTTAVGGTVSEGMRAVTVSGLLPAGIESGDEVEIRTSEATVDGDVLAVEPERRGGFDGGSGRVTVAVSTPDAGAVLEAESPRVAVNANGSNAEGDAIALLERAGRPVIAVDPASGSYDPGDALAVRADDRWWFEFDESDVTDGNVSGVIDDATENGDATVTDDPADVDRAFIARRPAGVEGG